jgi:uncharacterized membrane protein YgcG
MKQYNNKSQKTGSVVAIVLTVVTIVGIIALALMQHSIRSSRTAAWTRDHLQLRLLAESAADELFWRVQSGINNPDDKLFKLFRELPRPEMPADLRDPKERRERFRLGGGRRGNRRSEGYERQKGDKDNSIVIGNLKPLLMLEDLKQLEKKMGTPLKLDSTVTLERIGPTSLDPLESRGLVRFDVTVKAGRHMLATGERVRIARAFRISRATLPSLFGQTSLFVRNPPRSILSKIPKGTAAFSLARQGVRTLADLVDQSNPDCLQPVPDSVRKDMMRSAVSLFPRSLFNRAQYVTRTIRKMNNYIEMRRHRDLPINGVHVLASPKILRIDYDNWKGKTILATMAPVVVTGNITMADPKKDSLTIISGGPIFVRGDRIEASLVSIGPGRRRGKRGGRGRGAGRAGRPNGPAEGLFSPPGGGFGGGGSGGKGGRRKGFSFKGVFFTKQSEVLGSVISQNFPRGRKMPKEELSQVKLSSLEDRQVGTTLTPVPEKEQSVHYVGAFSPQPVHIEHLTDSEKESR